MGSPTSFPILCLINLAATKVAFEEFFRENGLLKKNEYFLLSELPMCVNGDDILFWCYDGSLYSKWKEVTKACGLKFSLGKNYTHNNVAIINSQMYFYEERKTTSFTKTAHKEAHPSQLFCLSRSINARLLAGGSRAESRAKGGMDLRELTDKDIDTYSKTIKESDAVNLPKQCGIRMNTKSSEKYKQLKTLTQKLDFLRTLQRKDPILRADLFETYTKWRTTVEQRGKKGLSILKGNLRTPFSKSLEEAYTNTYNNIQLKKLDRFRKSGLGGVDKDTPFFLPQSLGGLGLRPPHTHKYTAQDYVEIAALEGCDVQGEKWVRQTQPTLVRPSMMKAVASELSMHKKILNIKKERKTHEQIGFARFFGEEDGFWEHSFLTGFITSNNTIVGEEERTDALRFIDEQNHRRSFKNSQLMRSLKRQRKIGCRMGLFKVEKVLGSKRLQLVNGDAYPEGFEIDVESVKMTYEWVPSPKYE